MLRAQDSRRWSCWQSSACSAGRARGRERWGAPTGGGRQRGQSGRWAPARSVASAEVAGTTFRCWWNALTRLAHRWKFRHGRSPLSTLPSQVRSVTTCVVSTLRSPVLRGEHPDASSACGPTGPCRQAPARARISAPVRHVGSEGGGESFIVGRAALRAFSPRRTLPSTAAPAFVSKLPRKQTHGARSHR